MHAAELRTLTARGHYGRRSRNDAPGQNHVSVRGTAVELRGFSSGEGACRTFRRIIDNAQDARAPSRPPASIHAFVAHLLLLIFARENGSGTEQITERYYSFFCPRPLGRSERCFAYLRRAIVTFVYLQFPSAWPTVRAPPSVAAPFDTQLGSPGHIT